jgi:hypothetical protein
MAIEIEKVEGGWIARVSPPHGEGREWASNLPQPADMLIKELEARGATRPISAMLFTQLTRTG